jgi:hypothetical protein
MKNSHFRIIAALFRFLFSTNAFAVILAPPFWFFASASWHFVTMRTLESALIFIPNLSRWVMFWFARIATTRARQFVPFLMATSFFRFIFTAAAAKLWVPFFGATSEVRNASFALTLAALVVENLLAWALLHVLTNTITILLVPSFW